MNHERADHWDGIFTSRDLNTVSWFEDTPTTP